VIELEFGVDCNNDGSALPLPWGEGWGEGFRPVDRP
jgi:hypothetical protein